MADELKVLIGCEESQVVCKAFRKKGHEAYSCDIIDCSGGHPEWHIKGDVLEILDDGWDLGIFHPPCTRLTVTANRWFKPEYANRYPNIQKEREDAINFFMALINANILRISVENPIGIMSTRFRKPNQIIQPYQFGHPIKKSTCLWLKNLPLLEPTNTVEPEFVVYNSKNKKSGKSKYSKLWHDAFPHGTRGRERSKTFEGIADAMAEQWGGEMKPMFKQQNIF